MSKRRSSHGFYLPDFSVISRIVLAIGGSYGIAVLTDLLFLALTIDDISAIYWGQITSVVVCALMIILVFSLRRLWLAWAVVASLSSILGLICYATI
ncbi:MULTISPECIES: hypothetical protein [Psychrobacter]|uniref:Iron uptake protein n=1 Tax=Psychrobacter alimentarius TaxID=261164 RepID=A0ABM5ZYN5_9GAMM|nr:MULTISPECIES: hypothetical protein [Psychrobacter]AMT97171.1 hypothetical protein A3K91_1570 [Psychrobacter alimentarius]QCB30499.1 hypothetical protein E5677_05535 [Psychrobacter sp. PAMC27889]